jgi:hypothetical protein
MRQERVATMASDHNHSPQDPSAPSNEGDPSSGDDTRRKLIELQKKRRKFEEAKPHRQSLEGLRLDTVLRQMEALQALQGLQELNPSASKGGRSLKIPADPEERERQKQWLRFKADWLEALLESTLLDLEKFESFKEGDEPRKPAPE